MWESIFLGTEEQKGGSFTVLSFEREIDFSLTLAMIFVLQESFLFSCLTIFVCFFVALVMRRKISMKLCALCRHFCNSETFLRELFFTNLLIGVKENNVVSTNPFVLLVTLFTYHPARVIKPLYVKKKFLLQAYFLQI